MTDYGLRLLPQHQELLVGSAISSGVARARGYVSVTEKTRLEPVGFSPVQRRVPGLLIPVHGVTGDVVGHEYRPDVPRVTDAGRTLKYEKPAGSRNRLDVPPAVLPKLVDPSTPLWFTEGARKVDAAVTAGLACVGLAGVNSWRGKDPHTGGTVALPDFESVAFNDRDVVIAFDSDAMTNPKVLKAVQRFRVFLFERGARTRVCVLPGDDGKVGLDDFLAAGGTREDLESLVRDSITADDDDVVGRAFPQHAPVPDPEPEEGSAPLDDAARLIRRFVTAHKHVSHVCAVWVMHAYAVEEFWTTPRLIVESPEPECGKSMLLDTMGFLLVDPVTDVSITPAALARTLLNRSPAFLLDECDKTIGRNDAAQSESLSLLLAVANAGYRRGKTLTRCIGKEHEPVQLPTFAPIVFAGLNSKLDWAFRTRGISLWMDRAEPREEFEWSEKLGDEFARLRGRLRAWAKAHGNEIRLAQPERPSWMKGRFAEIWVPLMRVAEVAGGPWPRRIREAANELSGKHRAEDDSWNVALLRAARGVFGDRDRIHSADLIDRLNAIEDAPWATWNDGDGLQPIEFFNRVVKHFKLHHSQQMRIGDKNRKGYERAWFEDAWRRYCPVSPPDPPSSDPLPETPATTITPQGDSPNSCPKHATESEASEPLRGKGCFDVSGSEPEYGATARNNAVNDPEQLLIDGLGARPVNVDHPARFSTELLPAIARPLADWRLPVHDPFAGTGERLGHLCDELGLEFSGTEIEPEWIVDTRVRQGDSTDAGAYPTGEYVVATSPTYPNGMADHFRARDDSRRHTYRQALQRTRDGADRPLHVNNTGRYNIRRGEQIEAQYWTLVRAAVAHWPDRAVVNVKDFYYENTKIYPLVDKWTELLEGYGYEVVTRDDVRTPGQRHGANRQRVDTEAVLICEKPIR
jgi:Protein of unknown function (DUF3631)/Domain of unknown function (DUF3854)